MSNGFKQQDEDTYSIYSLDEGNAVNERTVQFDKDADTATITENGESKEVSVQEGLDYLKDQGLQEETIEQFKDNLYDNKEQELEVIRFDENGNNAEAIVDNERIELSNEEAFQMALENGVEREELESFAKEKGLEDSLNAALENMGEIEETTTLTFDPGNGTATITENGETKEISATEAFEYAMENGMDKETLHEFAEENGLSENFREAESNQFVEEIKEEKTSEDYVKAAEEGYDQGVQEAQKELEQDSEKTQIEFSEDGKATITENGETKEISATEAFEIALEKGEDKEALREFAEENGLSENFKEAESNEFTKGIKEQNEQESSLANDAVNSFADSLSDSIIENNKNSDSAFDRGMGEMFERMDSKEAEADQGMDR
jgi:hypothetical protein